MMYAPAVAIHPRPSQSSDARGAAAPAAPGRQAAASETAGQSGAEEGEPRKRMREAGERGAEEPGPAGGGDGPAGAAGRGRAPRRRGGARGGAGAGRRAAQRGRAPPEGQRAELLEQLEQARALPPRSRYARHRVAVCRKALQLLDQKYAPPGSPPRPPTRPPPLTPLPACIRTRTQVTHGGGELTGGLGAQGASVREARGRAPGPAGVAQALSGPGRAEEGAPSILRMKY